MDLQDLGGGDKDLSVEVDVGGVDKSAAFMDGAKRITGIIMRARRM